MHEVFVSLKLEPLPDGGYLATSRDLPGLVAQGRTAAETIEIAQDVARKLVESYREHGDDLPAAMLRQKPAVADLKVPVTIG